MSSFIEKKLSVISVSIRPKTLLYPVDRQRRKDKQGHTTMFCFTFVESESEDGVLASYQQTTTPT